MNIIELQSVMKQYENGKVVIHDLNLNILAGEFTVFLGPSGCGKSTILRMIAGLEGITSGTLLIKGERQNEVPAKNRDIAVVFQNYALYPHMTVAKNIGFGLKMRRVPKNEIQEKVNRTAHLLNLEDHLNKYPRQMSGGQMQRVALGRAIVRDSDIFLMDEPLSNLDAKLRSTMRAEIVLLHRRLKATTIYVTHDQAEAMTMADRIVVLKDGEVQQIGTPKEIYQEPANLFVASFLGTPPMNLLPLQTEAGKYLLDGQPVILNKIIEGTKIVLGIRPEALRIDPAGELPLTITFIEDLGAESLLHGEINGAEVIIRDISEKTYQIGDQLKISVQKDKVSFYDQTTGRRMEDVVWK